GLTAAVSILSIVLLPALVAFLGRIMDRPFVMGPAAVAGQVAVAVVLPLAVGVLVRAFLRLKQVLTFGTRGPRRLYGAGVGLRPHFRRTGPWGFGGAGSRERGEASGRRFGHRGRELPFAGRRGGDYPVSAHRRRRMHSLHEAAAEAHGGLAARGPEGARVRPRAFPRVNAAAGPTQPGRGCAAHRKGTTAHGFSNGNGHRGQGRQCRRSSDNRCRSGGGHCGRGHGVAMHGGSGRRVLSQPCTLHT
ncbi:MAG: hypothetical protein JWN19_1946, partial [Arthrobacter sp.]|nr:hypothetical protein [Arthrobacter sp.]